jgi:predicted metal-dependent phosphoesterase TrpH
MTPNNILNMSMLNELDFIAITDHNSTLQLKIIQELQESYDFIVIPGVEVSVLEGFDVLCYFQTFDDALAFNDILTPYLLNEWGNYSKEDQIITDIYDTTLDEYDIPLTKTNMPYEALVKEIRKVNGALVLAHINRPSCTPLNVFKLENMDFDGIEIQPYGKEEYLSKNEYLNKYKIFSNSDSHSLLTINEKVETIELEEKSISSFFAYLRG